jgi:tetratricopeptide (TPR) repeat protein
LDDIFEVQDEISLKIANTLREKLTLDHDKDLLVKPPTGNIEAYDAYLKGLFHANKYTIEDAEIAIGEFKRALEIEPGFALPYTRLSYIYVYLGSSGKRPKKDVIPKAKKCALKGVELNDQSAESYEALANVYMFHEWDWDKAFESYEKALQLNPNYAGAYLNKGMALAIHGRYVEAIETTQKAIRLDPFSAVGNYMYAVILCFAGRFEDSSNQLNKLFEISPHFPDALFLKGYVSQLLGDYEKAKQLYVQMQEVPGFDMHAYSSLGGLCKIMGEHDKAEGYLEKLLNAEKAGTVQEISMDIAYLYAFLDKTEEMFHYLMKSVENKEFGVLYILGFPTFKKYHQDPRFEEIIERIGLR